MVTSLTSFPCCTRCVYIFYSFDEFTIAIDIPFTKSSIRLSIFHSSMVFVYCKGSTWTWQNNTFERKKSGKNQNRNKRVVSSLNQTGLGYATIDHPGSKVPHAVCFFCPTHTLNVFEFEYAFKKVPIGVGNFNTIFQLHKNTI